MTEEQKKDKKEDNDQKEPDKGKKQDKSEKTDKTAEQKKDQPPLLDEPIKVQDYIYLNILSLEGKAWAYMDLIAHPETQKHLKDMEQAKFAIDTIDTLFKLVDKALTDEQRKDLQTRLTNLRLNYAKK